MQRPIAIISAICCMVLACIHVQAEPTHNPDRKLEIMLPMRDGVELHTLIFFPPERAENEEQRYPAVVDRSPYGYGDMEWITDLFLPFGFVAVGQDMRGTEKSQGNFTMWTSDSEDSQDLGDWIVKQSWSNGQVYVFGASADGMGAMQTAVNNPLWLGAQFIAWAPAKIYDILFPFGAYKQKTTEDWLMGLTMPNPEVVYDNIQTVHENEMHSDYWASVELNDEIYKNIRGKSALWGGWYDLFEVGTLDAFEGYNTKCDPSVRYTSVLTVDPLGHCLEGAEFFTENAVQGRTAVMLAQLFEVYGIRPVARSSVRNITFYVMSSNDEAGKAAGQYWTSLETWPETKMTDYYLHSDGSASTKPTSSENSPSASTSFVYDPSNPVPTMGGNNLPESIGGSIPCGPLDQAEVDKRADVLVFQSEAFTEELALTGPLMATLYVSSDAIDTDFMVRISDVYPTGEARLLQDNAVRMRWRTGALEPVYMSKGEVYKVEMNLWNTSYVVAPGHSLRFAVTSSNSPRFSPNPNNGLLLADPLYPGENIIATNTIFHSAEYPSKVSLPVVHKRQIPEVHVIKEVQKSYPSIDDEKIKRYSKTIENMMKRPLNKMKK